MVEFKEGAVCYACGKQWVINASKGGYDFMAINDLDYCNLNFALEFNDFQLNEPREGYYIPKSELDTEEKYNRAVEVFGLFGYEWEPHASRQFKGPKGLNLLIKRLGIVQACEEHKELSVRITFEQLMAIGELKRKVNARENEFVESRELDVEMIKKVAGFEDKPAKKRKAKEAYRILESMDIEWDNVECKWFKKEWL